MPKISIVTATYNSSKYINQVAESIVRQTFEDWEWLIVDDYSTDETITLLKEWQKKDQRIKLFKNTINSGAAVSRNKALTHAKGEYIAFIDSDDLWKEIKLEKQLEFMLQNKCGFSFTAYAVVKESGEITSKTIDFNKPKRNFTYNDMLYKKATLGCSTVMIKRDIIADLSMPLLRTGQDYAFWLKILKNNNQAFLFNEILTYYRIVPGSISRNKFKKAKRQWQIYREVEGLNLLKSTTCFIAYAYRALTRR